MKLSTKIFSVCAIALAAVAVNGCAYRVDLKQGNYVEQEAINQLRQGMTAEQVRFIMGTPMLTDAFDNSRWYYVHYDRRGWTRPDIANLVLVFEGRLLKSVEGDFEMPASFYSGQDSIQKIDFSNLEGQEQATALPRDGETSYQADPDNN